MTTKSFTFTRDDVESTEPLEPKALDINGRKFILADKLSTIELVLFASSSIQVRDGNAAMMLPALDRLFRRTLGDEYDGFIDYVSELDLEPGELGEVARGIVEIYTVRPTVPS